ncbi:MAG: hypothetical protein ACYCOU_05915 [Sulfobacillus sp.]
MQKIGSPLKRGLSAEDLRRIACRFREIAPTEKSDAMPDPVLVRLNDYLPPGFTAEEAHILVVRRGTDRLCGAGSTEALWKEQCSLKKDTKALMYGRVVEKRARHNLCFGDSAQTADFAQGRGTVVAFDAVPQLRGLRDRLSEVLSSTALEFDSEEDHRVSLQCEGNYYYDIGRTYIGFHGDTERRLVVAVRLGADFPLWYQWYQNSRPVGRPCELSLGHGDIYIMSDKAVGHDWKRKKIPTLRHAAGRKEVVFARGRAPA